MNEFVSATSPFVNRMVAITGGIGSGKSVVSGLIRKWGYPVVDADVLAKRISSTSQCALDLVGLFGSSVLDSCGAVDRAALRKLVLHDSAAMHQLNAYFHPRIAAALQEIRQRLVTDFPGSWLFYEAALVFETDIAHQFDAVVLVTSAEEQRIARLVASRSLDIETIKKLMSAQWTDAEKSKKTSLVINNSGTLEDLCSAVGNIVTLLRQKF